MLNNERDEYLQEIYELVKENNKLLHSQKRARIFSGIMKLVWLAFVVAVPIWFYFNYLAPMLENIQSSMAQLEALGKMNPALGEKLNPIIESVNTVKDIFNAVK